MLNRAQCFLYVDDARPRKRRGRQRKGERSRAPINRILQPGQKLSFKLSRSPSEVKDQGSTHITLPGRNLVLMPHVDYAGVSAGLQMKRKGNAYGNWWRNSDPGMGLIVRTAAEGKERTAQLREDMEFPAPSGRDPATDAKGPTQPYYTKDLDLVYRIMRTFIPMISTGYGG